MNLNPIDTGVLAGIVGDSGKLGNWIGKLIVGTDPGDHRNWRETELWENNLSGSK